jgi:hypothetical protein
MITDNFVHRQNPWCVKCDDEYCQNPTMQAYPVDLTEGMRLSGMYPVLSSGVDPTIIDCSTTICPAKQICGPGHICMPDMNAPRCDASKMEYPVMPGMDALYAIYPIFYAIQGASHPWYTNNLSDKLDTNDKGGHRFGVPACVDTIPPDPNCPAIQFSNSTASKTYQAIKSDDGLGISYQMAKEGARINLEIRVAEYCENTLPIAWSGPLPAPLAAEVGIDTCESVMACFGSPPYPAGSPCEGGVWSVLMYYGGDFRYRDLDRIEAMLIMMQDMVDLAGHNQWRTPGYLEEP